MRRLMNEAIADERFEDAARYRDEQKDIAPHSLLKCSSDATTLPKTEEVKKELTATSADSQAQKLLCRKLQNCRVTLFGICL